MSSCAKVGDEGFCLCLTIGKYCVGDCNGTVLADNNIQVGEHSCEGKSIIPVPLHCAQNIPYLSPVQIACLIDMVTDAKECVTVRMEIVTRSKVVSAMLATLETTASQVYTSSSL